MRFAPEATVHDAKSSTARGAQAAWRDKLLVAAQSKKTRFSSASEIPTNSAISLGAIGSRTSTV